MQTIGIKVLTIVPSCLVLTFLLPDIIFNCYLAAPRPTLGYYRGGSLTHPMLITAFLHIRPEGHRKPCNEFGSLSPADRLVGFETGTFRFWLQPPHPQSFQIPLLLVFFWFSVVILLKITEQYSIGCLSVIWSKKCFGNHADPIRKNAVIQTSTWMQWFQNAEGQNLVCRHWLGVLIQHSQPTFTCLK